MTYSLRLAEDKDFDDVLRMSSGFHQESPYSKIPFSEDRILEIFNSYLSGDKTNLMILLLEEGTRVCGVIVSVVSELPFSRSKGATELIWWVDHEDRKKKGSLLLFKAYEFWAQKVGAVFSSAVSTEGTTKLDNFYTRSGYTKAETTYVKRLGE